MSVTLTIRDVPEDVRDLLVREARARGQSLQAFLVSVLRREARFGRNRELLADVEHDLEVHGGADAEAPDARAVLTEARAEREVEQRRTRGKSSA